VGDDGTVLVLHEEGLFAASEGERLWSIAEQLSGTLATTGDIVVVSQVSDVVILALSTGELLGRYAIPYGPEAEKGTPPRIVAQAWDSERGPLFLSSDARFHFLDTRRCRTGAEPCTRPAGYLHHEYAEADVLLQVAPDGTRLLSEDRRTRAFDVSLAPLHDVSLPQPIREVALIESGDLVVISGDELFFVSTAKCVQKVRRKRGRKRSAPERLGWPVRAACISARQDVPPTTWLASLGPSGVLVATGTWLARFSNHGETKWRVPARVKSRPSWNGGDYVLAVEESAEAPLHELVGRSVLDGSTSHRVELPNLNLPGGEEAELTLGAGTIAVASDLRLYGVVRAAI
jgi:hypothetical protein